MSVALSAKSFDSSKIGAQDAEPFSSVTLTSTSMPRNDEVEPMKLPHRGRAC
jgi:hypothetical protein